MRAADDKRSDWWARTKACRPASTLAAARPHIATITYRRGVGARLMGEDAHSLERRARRLVECAGWHGAEIEMSR